MLAHQRRAPDNQLSGSFVKRVVEGGVLSVFAFAREGSTCHVVSQSSVGGGRHSGHPVALGLACLECRRFSSPLDCYRGDCLLVQSLCRDAPACVSKLLTP